MSALDLAFGSIAPVAAGTPAQQQFRDVAPRPARRQPGPQLWAPQAMFRLAGCTSTSARAAPCSQLLGPPFWCCGRWSAGGGRIIRRRRARTSMRRLRHRRSGLRGAALLDSYRRTSRFTGPGTGMPVSIPYKWLIRRVPDLNNICRWHARRVHLVTLAKLRFDGRTVDQRPYRGDAAVAEVVEDVLREAEPLAVR
jgi:hypothetical protein